MAKRNRFLLLSRILDSRGVNPNGIMLKCLSTQTILPFSNFVTFYLFICINDLALRVIDFSAIVKHHNKRIACIILIFIAAVLLLLLV
jgi:uncharacterized membrane protein YwzB